MTERLALGIDGLLRRHASWLRGKRVGLVSHAAALDARGASTADRLREALGPRLAALFGPEHGFFGAAAAGEATADAVHPVYGIPVHSLYGNTRRPTAAMLRGIDVVVYDMQDLGVRPYTYVSTLRGVLEAAAEHGQTVIVADRPIPLPGAVDGPVRDPGVESFVAHVRTPMAYGMTPGEAALWIRRDLGLEVDLRVAAMTGYGRSAERGAGWPPWASPSPGIRTWESACTYLATVFAEATPAVDFGRMTSFPFQVLGSPWMESVPLCARLRDAALPGVAFHPHPYVAQAGAFAGRLIDGVRLTVLDRARFRPVRTSVALVAALQDAIGARRFWQEPGTRPEFFDTLFGTPSVRQALLAGRSPSDIARAWVKPIAAFRVSRSRCLLYPES